MTATSITTAELRAAARQVIAHRRRVAAAWERGGRAAASDEITTFVQVGSRAKFLTDRLERAEFYAICRAMGREFDRLHAADLARRAAEHDASEYRRQHRAALTAAAT